GRPPSSAAFGNHPPGRPRRPVLLTRNGTRVALLFLHGTCGFLGDSCGHPELSRRGANEALEVIGELALVREAGAGSHLRQGQVALQQLLGPFDAPGDDVLVRRQPGGPPELPREMVDAETSDSGHLLQGRAGVEVVLDVLRDGTELRSGELA